MSILTKKKIIFSEEAHFDLGGYVNKQNSRIWVTENLHAYIEKPTDPKHVTVWCGFLSRGIIEPFFFEQGEAVTVNGVSYRARSRRLCVDRLDKKPGFESQARRQNEIRKVFLRRFPLRQISGKNSERK